MGAQGLQRVFSFMINQRQASFCRRPDLNQLGVCIGERIVGFIEPPWAIVSAPSFTVTTAEFPAYCPMPTQYDRNHLGEINDGVSNQENESGEIMKIYLIS